MESNTSQFSLPADLISGEVEAADAIRPLSVFDMFRVGVGPSSSHTVGPMRAGLAFAEELAQMCAEGAPEPTHLTVDLFGSLGATGRGHSTDRAALLGLAGHDPQTVDLETVKTIIDQIRQSERFTLLGGKEVEYVLERDMRFLPSIVLPYHVNALTITALTRCSDGYCAEPEEGQILRRTYYSVGGGFVMAQTNDDVFRPEVEAIASAEALSVADVVAPYPFSTAAQLLEHCEQTGLSIAQIVRANEEAARSAFEVNDYLDYIYDAMNACVDSGCRGEGILPGGLNVRRRAPYMADRLSRRLGQPAQEHRWAATLDDPLRAMEWVNLYALAVNEENAAGHRVVTAPTNGAAGVIPAVLGYLEFFCPEGRFLCGDEDCNDCYPAEGAVDEAERVRSADCRGHVNVDLVRDFLLASTAVGALIKTNASIAGAEVGCQGEVGSASAMAAAGLAQALGGTPQQVENAAEIAMEHSLGLTCDPVAGLVQVPCIERNAIAAVKAINAARMALWGDGRHTVTLDAAIKTMWQTGRDMLSKYKETSVGGLAVNVVEC
ncbi:L-serine ammonia-lyase, iron-sulfur-dependent, subunit alpha [Boudabousia marimammalium]|uniref:L-serine dehydratase n=1 Tax=Boudabousia marimammalium TaxID=156892 RepID=A0A1Q5PSW0_9ACTO|nr:L-serine ammonia-lyase, iron-sulfur-dependent, subunit alpha [Boudabousia marimammalium]OKL50535.1 L-serine ammonia-lyase [Boudabousia marimammalium]